MAPPTATLVIDSDWATLQLITEGATIQKIQGNIYPPNLVFTETGLVYGQPNKDLQPRVVEFQFFLFVNHPKVTFITGKGDSGTTGPRGGLISLKLVNGVYSNHNITDDGLNIKVFHDAPIFPQ
jgi:hypothetical protein